MGFSRTLSFHRWPWLPQLPGDHPLLSAPFLTFISIILVVAIFYQPLKTLLSRGALTIRWGDREISITEIEESVDTQFHELESKLGNIADEIEVLKKNVPTPVAASVEEPRQEGDGVLAAIPRTFPEAALDDLASILFHLSTTTYKWRNQETLGKRTGLGSETVDTIVLSAPELVVRSRAKSGKVIYRLTTEAKSRFVQATRSGAV